MASLTEIFKEALTYPSYDFKALLILGIVFVVANISQILESWGIDLGVATISILGIISIILYFIIQGYSISVLKETIEYSDEIPALNLGKNLVSGIKFLVVEIIYWIIPIILSFVVFFISGGASATVDLAGVIQNNTNNFTANVTANSVLANIPQEYINSFLSSFSITIIIAVILFLIFGLLLEIAMCRFAKYDSIGEALSIGEVIADIRAIGIGKFIGWYIIYIIIAAILGIIAGIVTAVPYIGVLVSFILVGPFIFLFASRALGNLYLEADV
ncbi:DUF4013 domain-containing protein [uncultured Methanobrevibacter sp.]|uniref:DUF4013 domain-containing protein n=1 Tax=uncultured Methanobrevibacter sp. TaxID=253161 RepID=UPI0026068064